MLAVRWWILLLCGLVFPAAAQETTIAPERSVEGLLQEFSRGGDLQCLVDAYKLCQAQHQTALAQSGRAKEAALEACLQTTCRLTEVLTPLVDDKPSASATSERREGESAADYEQRVRENKERIKQALYQRDILKLSKAVIDLSLKIMSDYGNAIKANR